MINVWLIEVQFGVSKCVSDVLGKFVIQKSFVTALNILCRKAKSRRKRYKSSFTLNRNC